MQMKILIIATSLATRRRTSRLEIHLPVLTIHLTSQKVKESERATFISQEDLGLTSSKTAGLRRNDGVPFQPPASGACRLLESKGLIRHAGSANVEEQACVG